LVAPSSTRECDANTLLSTPQVEMGFPEEQCRNALKAAAGNKEATYSCSREM